MPYDPIQGQGQGHGGRKVAKMACSQITNGEYLNFNWTIFFIFVLVRRHVTFRLPPSWNLQMIISVERMVLSTPCLMLCYGFQGRQIEWRYFQFAQEPSVVAFCRITSVLVFVT